MLEQTRTLFRATREQSGVGTVTRLKRRNRLEGEKHCGGINLWKEGRKKTDKKKRLNHRLHYGVSVKDTKKKKKKKNNCKP